MVLLWFTLYIVSQYLWLAIFICIGNLGCPRWGGPVKGIQENLYLVNFISQSQVILKKQAFEVSTFSEKNIVSIAHIICMALIATVWEEMTLFRHFYCTCCSTAAQSLTKTLLFFIASTEYLFWLLKWGWPRLKRMIKVRRSVLKYIQQLLEEFVDGLQICA